MCTNLDKLMLLLTLTLMLLMYYEKCTYKSRKCANCFILIIYILLQDLVQNLKKTASDIIYIYLSFVKSSKLCICIFAEYFNAC